MKFQILLKIYFILMFGINCVHSQCIKKDYFVLEIAPYSTTFEQIPFTKTTPLLSTGFAYVFDNEALYCSIIEDSIDLKTHKKIIDPNPDFLMGKSLRIFDNLELSCTSGFINLFLLDTAPIVKIRNRYYVIINLKYKARSIKEEIILESLGFKNEEVEIFEKLIELCDVDKKFKSHLWKIRSELDDFD